MTTVIEKNGSIDDFIESLVSSPPQSPKSLHLRIETDDFENTFQILVEIFTKSMKYLYGDSRTNQFGVGYNSYSLFSVSRGAGYIYAKSLYGPQIGRIMMSNTFISIAHTSDRFLPSVSDPDSASTYHILELIVNRFGVVDDAFRNGTEIARISTLDSLYNFTNSNTMLIGAYNNGTGGIPPQGGLYLQGNVAEIVSYANTYDMTSETRQRIEGVLAWKWGLQSKLPVGHPHSITPPLA